MSLSYYHDLIDKITSGETNPVFQARFKMLIHALVSTLVFLTLTSLTYLFTDPGLPLLRTLVVSAIVVAMLFSVYNWKVWGKISHAFCWAVTLVIWSNLFVFVQGINIPTLQYVFLLIVYSIYVHGFKWGAFYSFLNVVPLILYSVLDGRYFFSIPLAPQVMSEGTLLFVISYNFLMMIFLHYHFFKVFNRNVMSLLSAKKHLSVMKRSLKEVKIELEKTSRKQMDFLSTMSHEFRTPLNGVIGLSNVIMMENPREDQKENLAILKSSAENLLSLSNDILDLNKLDAKAIEMESIPFYIGDILENTAGSLKLNAEKKDLAFGIDMPSVLSDKLVESDPTRLTQVLTNLVNNAIKFTDKGRVNLGVEVLKIDDKILSLRFSVIDTGIGIDVCKRELIFEPFTQASKNTTRKFGGTGLGLPIVKNILMMFNSEVHIESVPGQGSTFYFDIVFPYITQVAKVIKERSASKEELAGLRVLVVEDNLINIVVIRKILQQWGVIPVVAENGLLAVDKIGEQDFDVVLMDVHMPVMDGYEATKKIRSLDDQGKANVPIIALTASVSLVAGHNVLDAGMDGYISKPFKPDHLYQKLLHFYKLQLH